MGRNVIWSNLPVYSAAHALVDAACAATLFAIVALGREDPQDLFNLILIYNVIAFSTQPLFGLLVDARRRPQAALRQVALGSPGDTSLRDKSPAAQAAVVGILLVAAATLSMPIPLLAAVLAGLGNALFHVGGGVVSLNLAPGKAALPGIYVAPGALGLALGIMIGKSGNFVAWPFLLLLLLSVVLILIVPRVEIAARPVLPGNLRWFEAVILLLLLSVAIRSMVGMSLVMPWKSDPLLLIVLTLAVVLGKALGGILGDRFGWAAVAVSGLAVSIPLLAFFAPIPALAIAGLFLFNLSMPITLICVTEMLPGKAGFAFGLTTLALIIGALPTFTPLRTSTGQPWIVFVLICISVVALYAGLRLFNAHFRPRLPAGRIPTQPDEKE
jgi:MFS transporter, FSR family, fosmidomycin resistance protein